jgi:pimeloyl-ACP methyl ester carboxylesterase
MQTAFFPYKNGRIHYLKFGTGPKFLVALHGFADRARMFAVLEPALAETHTVVAIDLPWHGLTEWPDEFFTKKDLLAWVEILMKNENFERLELMGFSFGGRMAQAILPDLLPKLDKLYLISPDGVKTTGMTAAARTPMFVRRLMKKTTKKPAWFLNLIKIGTKTRIVHRLILHFLQHNLTKPDRHARTFGLWLSLNEFYIRRRNIKQILRESGLSVVLVFGEKDPMIKLKTVEKIADGLPNVQYFKLPGGHRLIGEELAELLKTIN